MNKDVKISYEINASSSYYCGPNCNSVSNLTIRRHIMDNKISLLWSCKDGNHSWKETWSSYSKSIWSSQYQNNSKQPKQQQLQIASEVL